MVLFAAAGLAAAQGIDLGAMAGGGGVTASGPTRPAGQVGVEACFPCSGRFAFFGEYSHWFASDANVQANPSDLVRRMILAGGGLRIQGRGSVQPFFDVGVVGGADTHGVGFGSGSGRGQALGGVVVGGGVRIPLGERWYIRPQVRAYGLSPHTLEGVDAHWAVSGLAGIGYSWK